MQSPFRFLSPRLWGAALAAALGLAAGLAPVPLATAATVTLNGGTTSCTYSGSTVTAAGDFTFTCTGGSSPGTLALNLTGTSTTLAPLGTTTFAVTRTGQTAGSGVATGNLAITGAGGCTLDTPSVAFGDGLAVPSPATVTLTAGPTAGTTCIVTLTATGASTGAPSTTTINITDPNAPAVFAFSSATATGNFGGPAVTLTVTRTGGTAGEWIVPFVIGGTLAPTNGTLVAGGGTLSPPTSGSPFAWGTLNFPAGSGASKTITYTPPATVPAGVTSPASLAFQLLTPTAVGTPPPGHMGSVSPSAFTNTVTVSTPTGCVTTATHTVAWNGSQTIVSQVKQNETGAVSMTPTAQLFGTKGFIAAVVAETSSTGDQADVHFTISACPGDFTPAIGGCAQHTQYSGGTLRFTVGPKGPQVPWYLPVCELPAGTATVYFNFRQIRRPTPTPPSAAGTPSCQFTSCPVYVQFN